MAIASELYAAGLCLAMLFAMQRMLRIDLRPELGTTGVYVMDLQIVQHDIAGMRLDYAFPFNTVLALVPTILGAAVVAAIWPAEAAVHGSLVEALEYE